MNKRRDPLNKRLVIYYGKTGSGKTIAAEYDWLTAEKSVCCIESMKRQTLLNEIRGAMEGGKPIILEGIDCLNVDCLSLIFELCNDGIDEYVVDDRPIKIEDGFKIVATALFSDQQASSIDKRISILLYLVAGAENIYCKPTTYELAQIIEGKSIKHRL